MQNVVPLFSFQDKDQVKELDRSHKEIETLKKAVDLYRNKAKSYSAELDKTRQEKQTLFNLHSQLKATIANINVSGLKTEDDHIVEIDLSPAFEQLDKVKELGGDLTEIASLLSEFQALCVKQENTLSKIKKQADDSLSL